MHFVRVDHVALAGQAYAPRASIVKRLHAFEREADGVRVVPVGREGLADEARFHAFETVRAASEAHVLPGAAASRVAQDPFRGPLPHLWSLPKSRLELHAPRRSQSFKTHDGHLPTVNQTAT